MGAAHPLTDFRVRQCLLARLTDTLSVFGAVGFTKEPVIFARDGFADILSMCVCKLLSDRVSAAACILVQSVLVGVVKVNVGLFELLVNRIGSVDAFNHFDFPEVPAMCPQSLW